MLVGSGGPGPPAKETTWGRFIAWHTTIGGSIDGALLRLPAVALGDLYGFGPFSRIDRNPGSGSFPSWTKCFVSALGAGDGTPGYVGLAGEHPVYRVQIKLAAAAATVESYSSNPTSVKARRHYAARKRARAEEDEEQEDRVIGIGRDEDDEITSIGH